MAECSERIEKYLGDINKQVLECYGIANEAKSKGFDPNKKVMMPLAKNMAERVEGLIGSVAPEILGKGIPKRIGELEKEYGMQDWRVALKIAEEVAMGQFCEFEDKVRAMEVGIRTGFAYVTVGVVASPLEGFICLKLRDRMDGKGKYMALVYGGPIRSAGGTGASVSVLIADYVRKKMGYEEYDATEREVKRAYTELCDYHERVTNLQYFPSEEETKYLVEHLPIQLDGDPSEKWDVSNYKDLSRRIDNRISNGFCLITAECLGLKAPKVWKQLAKWGEDFEMGQWNFMKSFVDLQKEVRARGVKVDKTVQAKIKPDTNYIKDLVAGRPVFTHPMRNGGFRLRYGRGRVSGFSADSVNPATMVATDDFIAVGTQFKVERPGKATVANVCDSIDGPIVRLKNGSVVCLNDFEKARLVAKEIDEIIYLGDLLVNYGDFLDRAHKLVPAGFVEEWWAMIVKKVVADKGSQGIEGVGEVINFPLKNRLSFDSALEYSKKLGVPLYPKYIYYWNSIGADAFKKLYSVLKSCPFDDGKMIVGDLSVKRSLELIGCEHKLVGDEHLVIEDARALVCNLGGFGKDFVESERVLDMVNSLCEFEVKDKCGTFIGARMGRPEKAKMRKMKGSPHVLFSVGEEGGRLRCFQSALEAGKITAEFPVYDCECGNRTIYAVCEKCGKDTKQKFYCRGCKEYYDTEECEKHDKNMKAVRQELDIKHYFYKALEVTGSRQYPSLIKGVRGMSSIEKIPEHLLRGILRARHRVHVNKDGTIRYDMIELPLTHFKPKEIGTSIEKLKELGYLKDVYGKDLVSDDQILELIAQDVVLPAPVDVPEEGADEVLFRASKFIDDLLEHLYKLPRFYNLEKKTDLVGHLIIAMSPHTSAGIVSRIIGFSKCQGLYAHPLLHSIMRRDCLHYDSYISLNSGSGWQVVKIGDIVEKLNPVKKVDAFGTKAIKVDGYETLGMGKVKVKDFTKHKGASMYLVKTECGREIRVTKNHKFFLKKGTKKAVDLDVGDRLVVPYSVDIVSKKLKALDLLDLFKDIDGLMLRGVSSFIFKLVKKFGGRSKFRKKLGISKGSLDNYLLRDSFPINFVKSSLNLFGLTIENLPKSLKLGVVRCGVSLPRFIPLNRDVLYLLGLYVAEGYSRQNKRLNQVDFAMSEEEIRKRIGRIVKKHFKLNPSHVNKDRFVYSSRLFYSFFNLLGCGRIAQDKRVPSLVLNLPKKELSWFLQGYFDGDGSVSLSDCRVSCDSVSKGLLQDLEFVLKRFKIFVKYYTYKKKPGQIVQEFYINKGLKIPEFKITKLLIGSSFYEKFNSTIGFRLKRKQKILDYLIKNCNPYGMKLDFDKENVYPKVVSVEKTKPDVSYCLEVETHKILPNGILTGQCDGDEAGCMLLMDCLLNFSKKFLPNTRGISQDAPLVLTGRLVPSEVDDMVFNMDVVDHYPLELYEAAEQFKLPWDIKLEIFENRLNTEKQYEGLMFTHDTDDFNKGVICSAYKTLPSMREKVLGQMEVGRKIRAVDVDDVARLVIERHFIRDIKGNLRKYSQQRFRCVKCNTVYRRPPLSGKCIECSGKLVFTIAEGSICKYLEPALDLAKKYNLPAYLQQSLVLLKNRIESVFGKEAEKQEALGKWF